MVQIFTGLRFDLYATPNGDYHCLQRFPYFLKPGLWVRQRFPLWASVTIHLYVVRPISPDDLEAFFTQLGLPVLTDLSLLANEARCAPVFKNVGLNVLDVPGWLHWAQTSDLEHRRVLSLLLFPKALSLTFELISENWVSSRNLWILYKGW